MPRDSPRRDRDHHDPERRRERRQSRGDEYEAERRRRRGHRATDSQGELLASPRRKRHSRPGESTSSGSASKTQSRGSAPLSLDAIAQLDKDNQKKAGWRGYDYDEEYLKEVRRKEVKLEKERLKDEKEEKRRERERERERMKEAEDRRRAYESDVAAEEEARIRRERRRKEREEREREKKKAYTDDEREERRRKYEERYTPSERAERRERRREDRKHRTEQKKRRVISGPLLEEGGNSEDYEYQYMMEKRGGGASAPNEYTEEELARRKKLKRILVGVLTFLLILAIIIPVAVMMSKKSSNNDSGGGGGNTGASKKPANTNLNSISQSDIPASAKGTILDPFSWYDTEDFNVTYTDATVGGLPIMGLNSTWDDNVQANDKVANLQDSFGYGKTPIRGINVGGWLNMEPFITPSFFEQYSTSEHIIDEYTFCTKLGAEKCKSTLEKHYSSWVNRQTFVDIRNAGFDHVRIPFGYWAVTTYDGDPYVKQVSWRYLLRGIEYARQNGLRVNLDLHGAPGSQNGWNHSGRQGVIGWLNGTDGDLNAQRTLDIHNQLSQFFAQPRYKNVVTMYGILNEPRMVDLDTSAVLGWTQKAIDQIRKNNITAVLVFGDGFMGLDKWQGKLQTDHNLLLDVHQYVIFNNDQLSLKHTDKLNFACQGWTQQSKRSMDKTTGFGPTMCGEWSQADTDCTQYINDVGMGTRWEGTFDTGNASTSILSPQCPVTGCSCSNANADPGSYSDAYKKWLYQFAIAQMISFEYGWGWFYWTWDTEKAPQWSWKKGMAAGILPKKVWERDFDCPSANQLEDFGKLGLPESY